MFEKLSWRFLRSYDKYGQVWYMFTTGEGRDEQKYVILKAMFWRLP